MSDKRTFTCAGCGYTFATEMTEEEALEEGVAFYESRGRELKDSEDDPIVSTCDGCWDLVSKVV